MITDGLMLSDSSDEGPVWKTYEGPFTIESDGKYVIYARLTDKEGNSSTIMSDVIILDATAPVISGIVNGKVYCDDKVKFTVDAEYLKEVRINGEVVQAEFEEDSGLEAVSESYEDEKGFYIVTVGEDVQVIEVVDMSGNVTKYEITVNGCHTWKEPVVTWAEDELSAKFDFVCKYDETHTYSKEVQATLEIEVGATGSQKGTITHVVKVELDGKVYTAKQVNDTPVVEEEEDVKLVKDTLATIVKDLTVKNDYVSTEEVKSGIEYIDLSLYMKIDDNPEEKISQLKGKELTITMEIPENIKSDKKGRQYYVIRVHDGSEVEVLDSVIDLVAGTIKFKTDRFSIPKTADSSDVELFVLTFVAGVYMIVCAEKKRRA